CTKCGSENVKEYKLATTGKIFHFSTVTQTSDEMMSGAPYLIAIIELEDGIKVTGQIVDCNLNEAREGMSVRMVFRVLAINGTEGLIRYGFKFAPI
ncbi:MAG: Zn-ribbon domain-containing OB-fold protein, partial [Candidatus Heimdallarchaeaceae archaeon]